jgi:tetratricopeptide (TPR) repeat protein
MRNGSPLRARLAAVAGVVLISAASHAAEFIQNGWQGGAVAGSTTNLAGGLTALDSQDGNVVALSTGLRSVQNATRAWVQTDDGTGEAGFNRVGSIFSSAVVTGAGSSASLMMVVEETVTVKGLLPEARGDMATYYERLGRVFLLQKDYRMARAGFERAIRTARDLGLSGSGVAEAYLGLGRLLLEQGNLDYAQRFLQKALEVSPAEETRKAVNAVMAEVERRRRSP